MIKLPARSHVGCDPLCGSCQDAGTRMRNKLLPIVKRGIEAFWKSVSNELPYLDKSMPDDVENFEPYALESVLDWAFDTWNVSLNLPIVKMRRKTLMGQSAKSDRNMFNISSRHLAVVKRRAK